MVQTVLATNEMKSDLAGHIRTVVADPAARVFVGAHRRPEAVIMGVEAEFPYSEFLTAIGLVGRALGLELRNAQLAEAGDEPPLHEYERVLSALGERGQHGHFYVFMANAVRALGGHEHDAQRRALVLLDTLVGDRIGTNIDRDALLAKVEDSIAKEFPVRGPFHG